jgi:outer membrane biosynthesis protein TonB
MYFDFEDYRPEFNPVGRAISLREGVLLSIIVHLLLVIVAILTWHNLFRSEAAARQAAAVATPRESTTFVFVNPQNDKPAPKPPDRGEASDQNRIARARERAPKPENPLPLSRGNSPERVEQPPPQPAPGRGAQPEPQAGPPQLADNTPPEPTPPQKQPESPAGLVVPPMPPPQQAGNFGRSSTPGGQLGKALSDLQRYTTGPLFRNPQGGGGSPGDQAGIQFDTKGVEFGPWIRRFIERVRSNWNVPLAAMSLKGHVVITFNIHKSGLITDLEIVGPCPIASFNTAAYGALVASSPTDPLPAEYPDEHAFFTVTFYYNEQVP